MDPITGSLAAVTSATQALSAPPAALAPPDSLAAARFSAIMGHQPTPVAEAVQAALAPAAAGTGIAATAPGSMGERILSGMNNVSSDFQSAWKSVSTVLENGDKNMQMQDLLKLQLQLVQVSVQYDLVGKAVSRSTQNLDQLLRLQ